MTVSSVVSVSVTTAINIDFGGGVFGGDFNAPSSSGTGGGSVVVIVVVVLSVVVVPCVVGSVTSVWPQYR